MPSADRVAASGGGENQHFGGKVGLLDDPMGIQLVQVVEDISA
jgi:hypothetical protein